MLRFDDDNRLLKLSVHDLLDAGPAKGHLKMQVAWSSRTRMRIGQQIHTSWQDARSSVDDSFRREVRLIQFRRLPGDRLRHFFNRAEPLREALHSH